ncbi:MAG: Octanoyltransferase LipM [bacterium ADurb.Bin429]|nr:MAG: Octanoyltransferase LipM [bacterium ADurb.Bin429]
MITTWRWLAPLDGPGAFHMAADVAIAEAIRAGQALPTLRFYRWAPPCVTLGKFQPAEGNVQLDACTDLGYDVVRRPTGGRAILHDHEVTFSIIIAEADLPGAGSNIMESYRALGRALVDGLRRLDLPAELVDRNASARAADPPSVMAAGNPACFAAKARCDLMVNEKKLIGSAQLRKDGVIVQQNSLPLTIDFPRWDDVFYRSDWEQVMRAGAIGLHECAGRAIPYGDVVAALRAGFESALDISFDDGALSAEEEQRARELIPDYAVLTTGTIAAPTPSNF